MTARRVLVVRSGAGAFPPLEAEGLELVERVSHDIDPVEPPPSSYSLPADLAVFTSRIAVARVLGGARAPEFLACVARARVVAVGAATGRALAAAGLPPDLVAAGSGQSILDALAADLAGVSALLPCGEDASSVVAAGLAERGASVRIVVVYRKRPRPRDEPLDRAIADRQIAAWCATSPAAARWLFDGAAQDAAARLRLVPAVALGEPTRRCLVELGARDVRVASAPSLASAARLLEALATGSPGK